MYKYIIELYITDFLRESYGLKETGFLTLTYTKDKSKQMNKVNNYEIIGLDQNANNE